MSMTAKKLHLAIPFLALVILVPRTAFAQGPQYSPMIEWADTYSIPVSSFERLHNCEEYIDPSRLNVLETVRNNFRNLRVGFTFFVHDIP